MVCGDILVGARVWKGLYGLGGGYWGSFEAADLADDVERYICYRWAGGPGRRMAEGRSEMKLPTGIL